MTKVITSSSPIISRKNDVKHVNLYSNLGSDTQIRALGRWNQQLREGSLVRRNGYASYSLMKVALSRNLQI